VSIMLLAIVLAPLLAACAAGLFGRQIGRSGAPNPSIEADDEVRFSEVTTDPKNLLMSVGRCR